MITPKTILLVEDDLLIAQLNIKLLQNMDFDVVHCNSGEIALELIQTNNQKIDLILMDIDLGEGIDGTKTAESILQIIELPILFLSARTEKEMISKTEKISSYGYVVKNSDPSVLRASIKMAFRLFEAHQKIKSQNSILEESKKMFLDMTDNVPGVIYQFRFRSDGSSYFSFISPKAAELFGLPNDPLSKY
ncbi:MAG: response regulator [Leptospiraceae bacterium]|nr:response regulator [Leptospiraceae bacterium]